MVYTPINKRLALLRLRVGGRALTCLHFAKLQIRLPTLFVVLGGGGVGECSALGTPLFFWGTSMLNMFNDSKTWMDVVGMNGLWRCFVIGLLCLSISLCSWHQGILGRSSIIDFVVVSSSRWLHVLDTMVKKGADHYLVVHWL